jgi:hypothetical protein
MNFEILTHSYSSKNKRLLKSSEGFFALQKAPWYVLRGHCCSRSQVWQPSADSNGRLAHFFKVLTCWVGRDSPLQIVYNSRFECFICRGLPHPTRSLSRIVCRGQEGPKDSRGTLRPEFRANIRPWIFFKSHCHHKIQEDSCKELKV